MTREKVVEKLTALMDEVPLQARPYLAKVITILSTDGQDDVELITGVLGNTALPTDVAAILTQALELATGAINDAVGRLQGIVGMLPAAAQPMVQAALTLVTDSLQMVTTLVGDLFRGLFGGVPTTPGTGSPGGAPGGILGGGLPGRSRWCRSTCRSTSQASASRSGSHASPGLLLRRGPGARLRRPGPSLQAGVPVCCGTARFVAAPGPEPTERQPDRRSAHDGP